MLQKTYFYMDLSQPVWLFPLDKFQEVVIAISKTMHICFTSIMALSQLTALTRD